VKAKPCKIACTPIAWSAYTALFSIVSAAPTSLSTRKIATLCLICTSRVRVLSIVHVHRLDLIRVHVRTSTQDDNPSKAPQLLLVCNGCSPRSFRIFSDPRVAPPTCCKLVKLYYSYVLPSLSLCSNWSDAWLGSQNDD
jgi:hypothetical protein